jgi:Tol biopolymer transport system component
MNIPRQYGSRFLAALAVAALAAALPLARTSAQQTSAQQSPAKQQSPNGKIVFQSTQGGDGFVNDIYVMDADGKHQTRLTDDPADDTSAAWSPQGDKIAFLSARRGNGYELYLMNADGSNQHPLRDASPVVPFDFVWSPDGTRLAYSDGTDAYVVAADGTGAPVNVSAYKPAGTRDQEPSWSPNGGQLVVRSININCGGCSDLHVVNAFDGADRYALITGPGFDQAARWSPAGNLIAYEGDRGGRDIYVTRADGTGAETKVSGGVGSFGGAEWSPDGTRLAFKSTSSNAYVVNSDGSGMKLLSDVPADGGGTLLWSPDGTKVAFHNFNGSVDLYVANADGSRKATNYTKTKRDDEYAYSWQKLSTQ